MQSQSDLKMKGSLELVIKRANGEIEIRRKDNIIVNVGFDFIADAIGKEVGRPAAMSHIAIGSGTTAPDATQTALVSEITRLAATYAHTAGTKTFSFQATFGAGVGTGAITEAGVLNASTGGILFDRVTFAVVNKGADDTMTATFTFTMS